MSLCRHYVRELRRSVMIGTPDLEKSQSKRSSVLLENLGDMHHPPAGPSMFSTEKEKATDAQMSAFLREEAANRQQGNVLGHSPHGSLGTNDPNSPADSQERPRASFGTNGQRDMTTTDSNSPAHTVARNDLRASAEKILYTFLLPGSEREIILPFAITQDVIKAIEEDGRDDPELFDAAKDYVFQAMERDAFPGFLRMKALGNLVPASIMIRLAIGLLAMFGGFWAAFILIFLNKDRATRCWVSGFYRGCLSTANAISSYCPSQSVSTLSQRSNTLSILYSRSSTTASTLSCLSPNLENHMSNVSFISAP